jgi:iron complex transport system substrate-binding protein
VYAVNATAYFSRPGPRVVEGTRILARILHPDRMTETLRPTAAYRLSRDVQFVDYV